MQEQHNSSVLAMELCLSCTNPSICICASAMTLTKMHQYHKTILGNLLWCKIDCTYVMRICTVTNSLGKSFSFQGFWHFHLWIKCTSFSEWVKYFEWNFKSHHWNPNEISYSYIERYDFNSTLKFQELLHLWAHTHLLTHLPPVPHICISEFSQH